MYISKAAIVCNMYDAAFYVYYANSFPLETWVCIFLKQLLYVVCNVFLGYEGYLVET